MKKILLLFLFILPVFLVGSIYYLDRECFLCPIQYTRDIIIRSDSRGGGFFAAQRNGARTHQGLDLFAQIGTPVLAVRSGRVACANQNNGMGKYVIISHLDNMSTLYGHLSSIAVRNNEFVRQGQVIGRVGKTGNAGFRDIQPHLHFEVRVKGIAEDPLKYLS
ncbi:MAG: M23 family metallopeptidase [Candidatus Omnitrophota bacterium]